jgi:hypothetical protein
MRDDGAKSIVLFSANLLKAEFNIFMISELSLFTIVFVFVSQRTGTEYLPDVSFEVSYRSLMKCILSGSYGSSVVSANELLPKPF